jgi:hypothetical protein
MGEDSKIDSKPKQLYPNSQIIRFLFGTPLLIVKVWASRLPCASRATAAVGLFAVSVLREPLRVSLVPHQARSLR